MCVIVLKFKQVMCDGESLVSEMFHWRWFVFDYTGSCPACQVVLIQQCHCGRSQRDTVCKEEGEGGGYECGRTCGKSVLCHLYTCIHVYK